MKYPYYIGPMIEAYRKAQPDSPEALRLRRLIAVNIGDATSLCLILGIDSKALDSLYPGMGKPVASTMETIDTFLDKFGGKGGVVPGAYVIEPPENHEKDITDEELPEAVKPVKKTRDIDAGERVAKLIREKRYEEALQIIERQNLINTEKNIYFADQIRFLKKLIQIKKHKNKPQD